MSKKLTLKEEARRMISPRVDFDAKKHEDKMADRAYIDAHKGEKINRYTDLKVHRTYYRKSTYQSGVTELMKYGQWLKEKNGGHRVPLTSDEAKNSLVEYLKDIDSRVDTETGEHIYTPDTVKKKQSALAKAYQVDLHAGTRPVDYLSEKGRGVDPHYNMNSPEHAPATAFYVAVGARKGEYKDLSEKKAAEKRPYVIEKYGLDIEKRRDNTGRISNLQPVYGASGQVEKVITIYGKHGRTNCTLILPEERALVTDAFRTGDFRHYFYPSDHCNTHQCRRDHALKLYESVARDVTKLPRKDIYIRKADHVAFDKKALEYVGINLGHGENRCRMVANHYMPA